MSAAELLATKPAPAGQTPTPAANAQPPAAARRAEPLPEAFVPGLGGQDAVPGAGAQPNDKYRLIFLLASEGMDSANIAKHTNLTRGEVEMLLDLRRQGKI